MIIFSGIDSAGKSTQIEKLEKYLFKKNIKARVIWSRGGYTPIMNSLKSLIRKIKPNSIPQPGESIHRDKTFSRKWISSLWLNIALIDLIVFYCLYFRWLNILGYIVIADRYLWDTYIDFDLKFMKKSFENNILWKILVLFSPQPELSIILTLPIDESLRRSKLKKEPFSENYNQRQKRIELYHDLINKGRWLNVIDGSDSIEKVWSNIRNKLE